MPGRFKPRAFSESKAMQLESSIPSQQIRITLTFEEVVEWVSRLEGVPLLEAGTVVQVYFIGVGPSSTSVTAGRELAITFTRELKNG